MQYFVYHQKILMPNCRRTLLHTFCTRSDSVESNCANMTSHCCINSSFMF